MYIACTGFIFDKLNTNSIQRGEFKLQKQAALEWILEQFGSLKPVILEFIQNSSRVGFFNNLSEFYFFQTSYESIRSKPQTLQR